MKEIKKLQHLKEVQLPKVMQKMIMGGNTWGYEAGGDTATCSDDSQMGDSDFTGTVTDESGQGHKVDVCV